MKYLISLIMIITACNSPRYLECPKYVGIVIDTIPLKIKYSHKAERRYSMIWFHDYDGYDQYYDEVNIGDSTIRPLHCLVKGDTLKVSVKAFFDTLFTNATYIMAGGKIFKSEEVIKQK